MALEEAVLRVKPCVVQINLFARGLSEEWAEKLGNSNISVPVGTGFFVNEEGFIITANHVIDKSIISIEKLDADEKGLRIGVAQPQEVPRPFPEYYEPKTIPNRAQFTFSPFETIGQDERSDLALLKISRNPFTGDLTSGEILESGEEVPLLFNSIFPSRDRPRDGSSIGLSGYPLNDPLLYTTSGIIASSWSFEIVPSRRPISLPSAPPSLQFVLSHDLEDVFLGNIQSYPGHSGSPVYLASDATLIGVCVSSRELPIMNENDEEVLIEDKHLFYHAGITIIIPTYLVTRLLIDYATSWAMKF